MKKVRYSNKATTILGVYLAYQQRTGQQMSKEFQITYEVKGIQVVKVSLPEGTDVPANWNSLSIQEQDEWLYEHEIKTEKYYEDIHYSLPASILEIRHLKAVI